MNGKVTGDVCEITAIVETEAYRISLAGSVFAHDPSKDDAETPSNGEGLVCRIKGTVYKAEGTSTALFTALTRAMLTIKTHRADGTVTHTAANANINVSGGTFSCVSLDENSFDGEAYCRVVLTVGGKEVASESVQLVEYGPAGEADIIVGHETWYLRTTDDATPTGSNAPARSTPWSTDHREAIPTFPYVWMCAWKHWSISGWVSDGAVLLEKYIPQIRIISQSEWTEWLQAGGQRKFYKGAPGEPYRDLFLDAGLGSFYECIMSGTVAEDTHPVYGSYRATYWKAGTFWPSFGTNLLAAIHAYIEDLVVRKLETVRSEDGLSVTIEDGMITVNHRGTGQKALFGISDKGNLTLQFWRGSELLVGFGPDEVMNQISSKNSTWAPISMAYSSNDRSEQHKFNIPSSLQIYYFFTEGFTKIGSSGTYSIEYKIGLSDSQKNKPSVFSGKYLKGNASENSLKSGRSDPSTYIVDDGYYAFGFDTPVNNGANYECTQHHIVGGVIVGTLHIGYKKMNGYGMPIYARQQAGIVDPSV